MHNPSYLIKSRHSIYYFRYPLERLCGAGRRISVSLNTRCPKEALRFARALEYYAHIMINDPLVKNMDYISIKETLKSHFTEVLERMKRSIDVDGALPEDRVSNFKTMQSYATEAIEQGRDELYGGIFDDDMPKDFSLDETLEPIIKKYNLPADKDSKEHKALRKEYKYALDGYITALLSYNESNDFYDLEQKHVHSVSLVNKSELKLKNVVAIFSKEIKPHKGAKGFKDHMGCLNYLMEALGEDCLITQVDYARARKVKDMLQKTPSNRNKNALTRGLLLNEQIEIQKSQGLEPLSVASVNKNLGYIGALFTWAKRNKYVSENPFEGLKIKASKKAARRDHFEKVEVTQILDALRGMDISKAKGKTRYWGAMISMYTGARLNEVAALTPDDIKQDDETGVWYFDITDNDNSKTLKTEAGKRLVPIHSKLLELGLLDYVRSAREIIKKMPAQHGHKPRLLYDLAYTNEGKWGRKLGRGFNDTFLKDIGLKTDKKTLHSLRHSFITHLSAASVDGAIIKAIADHEADTVTTQTYTHFVVGHLPAFRDAVEKLKY